jgi:hypothetical protein
MTIRDEVFFEWVMSSDWPMLSGATYPVECLAARVGARTSAMRREFAVNTGDALAAVVSEVCAVRNMWLFLGTRGVYSKASKVEMFKYQKRRVVVEPALLAVLEQDSSVYEFDVSENSGKALRKGMVVRIGGQHWGIAAELMLSYPGVGIELNDSDATEEMLREIGGFLLNGENEGPYPAGAAISSRAAELHRIFVNQTGRFGSALVVHGEFDDPYLTVEYHHELRGGALPVLREIVNI